MSVNICGSVYESNYSIESLFLPEEKRYSMRKSKKFKKTNRYWNRGKFNYIQKIGSLSNIVSTAHMEWIKLGNKGIVPKSFFVDYYFQSGEIRQSILANNKQSYDINVSYGRTLNEVYRVSKNFYKYVNTLGKKDNVSINMIEAFNYVIIRMFDEAYEGFLREYNTVVNLSNFLKNKYRFIPSSINEDMFYSVDFIGYDKDNKLSFALQIKSDKYYYADNNIVYKQINERKHNKFYKEFGIKPIIVYSTMNGYILNNKHVLSSIQK